MAYAVVETFLVPPLIALVIYLLFVFAIVPLYRRRQRYSQYLPMSLYSENENAFLNRTRSRVASFVSPITSSQWWPRRRSRAMSFDTYFGDEELEEGMNPQDSSIPSPGQPEPGHRRLSRDLEAGFRDDSDEDDGDDRRCIRD